MPARAARFFVSAGSLTLVVMATLVKQVGHRIPSTEIFLFRSMIGFLFMLPLFVRDPLEPLRTRRHAMHLLRGATGTAGNICFFWTVTHLLLADAMALQFSRPLFMIPLAVLMLGEVAGWRRAIMSVIGFVGILLYARPFTAGFQPGAFVGALGRAVRRLRRHLDQAAGDQRADPRDHVLLRILDHGAVGRAGPGDVGDAERARTRAADDGRLPRHFRTGHGDAGPGAGRCHGAGAARLFAHRLFGRARLFPVRRIAWRRGASPAWR